MFNILPLYPLDGGRIIKGLLHIKFGNKTSKKIVNEISNITMYILSFIFSIAVFYFQNIAYFLICIVLWIITYDENRKFKNYIKACELIDNE